MHPTVQVVAPLFPRTKDPLSTDGNRNSLQEYLSLKHIGNKTTTKPISPLKGPVTPFIAPLGVHELSKIKGLEL